MAIIINDQVVISNNDGYTESGGAGFCASAIRRPRQTGGQPEAVRSGTGLEREG